MSKDLKIILNLLSLQKSDIYGYIAPEQQKKTYYDRDSEDDGTEFPEIALLRLCLDVFRPSVDINPVTQSKINEMSWLLSMALDLSYSGAIICSLHIEHSHELFWDVLRRYAHDILSSDGYSLNALSGFSFDAMLMNYGYSFDGR